MLIKVQIRFLRDSLCYFEVDDFSPDKVMNDFKNCKGDFIRFDTVSDGLILVKLSDILYVRCDRKEVTT